MLPSATFFFLFVFRTDWDCMQQFSLKDNLPYLSLLASEVPQYPQYHRLDRTTVSTDRSVPFGESVLLLLSVPLQMEGSETHQTHLRKPASSLSVSHFKLFPVQYLQGSLEGHLSHSCFFSSFITEA